MEDVRGDKGGQTTIRVHWTKITSFSLKIKQKFLKDTVKLTENLSIFKKWDLYVKWDPIYFSNNNKHCTGF